MCSSQFSTYSNLRHCGWVLPSLRSLCAAPKSCHLSCGHPQVPDVPPDFSIQAAESSPGAHGIQLLELNEDYLRTAWAFWDTQISTNFQQVAGVCGNMGSILSRRRNSQCQRQREASGPQSRLWIFTPSWIEAESCSNLTTFWSKVMETGKIAKLSLIGTLINC